MQARVGHGEGQAVPPDLVSRAEGSGCLPRMPFEECFRVSPVAHPEGHPSRPGEEGREIENVGRPPERSVSVLVEEEGTET